MPNMAAKQKMTHRRELAKQKTARRELTGIEKGIIIALFYCLGTIATIAQIVGCPWSTVKSFLVRATERGTLNNLPRSGRPSVLSSQEKRRLVRLVKKPANRKLTCAEFQDRYVPHVSLSTIDRVLQEANIRKWIAKKWLKLMEEHAALWLK